MYHHELWEEGVEESALGDPLLDVKLLGKAGVSKTARAFRHCARYDNCQSLRIYVPSVQFCILTMLAQSSTTTTHNSQRTELDNKSLNS